ncbi:histone acetyltransferase [Pseudohyphozyma bogoriensis]|nr:histone acetyltransferase [Pseudohyphozyma bogoriensis]
MSGGKGLPPPATASIANGTSRSHEPRGQKRPRESTPSGSSNTSHHAQPSKPRKIASVIFGGYEIQCGYPSPYPFEEPPSSSSTNKSTAGGSTSTNAAAGPSKPRKTSLTVDTANFVTKSVSPELTAGLDVAANGVKLEENGGQRSPSLPVPSTSARTVISPDLQLPQSWPSPELKAPSPLPDVGAPSPAPPPLDDVATPTISDTAPPPPLPTPTITNQPPSPPKHPPNAPPQRGEKGRFLQKPPGESVKAKRQIEKAARAAALAANPPPPRGMTVREQREKARAEREAREKAAGTSGEDKGVTKRLFVCDGCFKYMLHEAAHTAHKKVCTFRNPPGRKVYQRGAHTIWEVDGAVEKLYSQNLCLFSKLFIEHKYMFFDVEGFMFYVLTDATPSFDYTIGYFSKEKVSYDDNNLACIVTFPPYQKKGYGTLLIEFSYELSRRTSETPGSPERPLSDLGQKGYFAYWTGVLVRYFLAVFEFGGEPPELAILGTAAEIDERKKGKRSRGTLVECGLARWRRKKVVDGEEGEEGVELEEIVITKELVEDVGRRKGVKQRTVMELAHVLL